MHIALNAQLLNLAESYRGAGVSNYSRRLLQELGAQAVRGETPHRLAAFVSEAGLQIDGIHLVVSRLPLRRPALRVAWEQAVLPVELRRVGAELVHGLVNVLPLASRLPGVVTVHDLSFVRLPETLPAAKRRYQAQLCRASVCRARRVIAVSRQTADDLVRHFRIPAVKIDVVYNGVGEEFSPGAGGEVERLRRERGLPARFLLYLGTLEPRKNLELLVTSYSRWRSRAAESDRGLQLVLAGAKGWYYDRLFAQVDELGLANAVVFPGYIPAAELPDWYRAAEGFVYPSRFEGFGLPVLEAMACGTPVLCGRTDSLLEVTGDAALTFAPESADELVSGLQALVSDAGVRSELVARGLERAARFSWRQTALATLAAYESA